MRVPREYGICGSPRRCYKRRVADVTKRVQKKMSHLLYEGEAVQSALLVEPKGTYGVASLALAALPRTTVRRLASKAQTEHESSGGLAAWFSATSCLVVVTDKRVAIVPSNGLSMKEISATYDRRDLVVAENSPRGLGRRLVFRFLDGTSVTVDAQRGQPFDQFAALLGGDERVQL